MLVACAWWPPSGLGARDVPALLLCTCCDSMQLAARVAAQSLLQASVSSSACLLRAWLRLLPVTLALLPRCCRGWRPMQVPFHEWAALEGSAAKQQYLDSMLKAMDS